MYPNYNIKDTAMLFIKVIVVMTLIFGLCYLNYNVSILIMDFLEFPKHLVLPVTGFKMYESLTLVGTVVEIVLIFYLYNKLKKT